MNEKKVLMVVADDFPYEDAGAVRDMAMGMEVFCICKGKRKSKGIVEGVKYYSIYKEDTNLFVKINRFLNQKKWTKIITQNLTKKYGVFNIILSISADRRTYSYLSNYAQENKAIFLTSIAVFFSSFTLVAKVSGNVSTHLIVDFIAPSWRVSSLRRASSH